jgi:hydroxymethylglutaryl-CoA lyase
MGLPGKVKIVEVGPRDGLQNEAQPIATATKLELIERLAKAGCRVIEATAFVSPKWTPQMADHDAVLRSIKRHAGVAYPVLTPNLQGFEAALAAGAEEVAVFASASESFSQKNINCSVAESLERFVPVMQAARDAGVRVRGYVSCVLGCPYEGDVDPKAVARVAKNLFEMGCFEISLGDTIGVGAPTAVKALIDCVGAQVPVPALAGHFHDTYGMAAANVVAALEMGVGVFDASVGGLGGCPYADGASGNVATEDLVWLFNRMGIETGIDLHALVDCAVWISGILGRAPGSRVAQAILAKRRKQDFTH